MAKFCHNTQNGLVMPKIFRPKKSALNNNGLFSAVLTPARLREVVRYNAETGEMVRLLAKYPFWGVISRPRFVRGKKAYCKAQIDGKFYAVHRLAFLYMTGRWPEPCTDHIDGDIHNNKWSNLREVTYSENSSNSAKARSGAELKRFHEEVVA